MIHEKKFTYQGILISDNKELFLLVNYHSLGMSGAVTGYSFDDKCRFSTFAPVTTSERLQETSNVGKKGWHLHWLSIKTCSYTGIESDFTSLYGFLLPYMELLLPNLGLLLPILN